MRVEIIVGRRYVAAAEVEALQAVAGELLATLRQAELDCRGYEALHGWLERATAAIGEAERIGLL